MLNIKCTCLLPQVNCFSGMCSYCNRPIVKQLTTEDLKYKKETLEELIKKQLSLGKYQDQESAIRHSIELSVKWQQEQENKMYSDIEVWRILIKLHKDTMERKISNQVVLAEWFYNIKKK